MRISAPYASGLRVATYNAAGVLLVMLVGATLSEKGDGFSFQAGFLQGILGILFLMLTFPANVLGFTPNLATGGVNYTFWLLNPVIWGVIAFAIRKFLTKHRERRNSKRAKC
jgi:hypothetical protein